MRRSSLIVTALVASIAAWALWWALRGPTSAHASIERGTGISAALEGWVVAGGRLVVGGGTVVTGLDVVVPPAVVVGATVVVGAVGMHLSGVPSPSSSTPVIRLGHAPSRGVTLVPAAQESATPSPFVSTAAVSPS